jgi:hypothetical protein
MKFSVLSRLVLFFAFILLLAMILQIVQLMQVLQGLHAQANEARQLRVQVREMSALLLGVQEAQEQQRVQRIDKHVQSVEKVQKEMRVRKPNLTVSLRQEQQARVQMQLQAEELDYSSQEVLNSFSHNQSYGFMDYSTTGWARKIDIYRRQSKRQKNAVGEKRWSHFFPGREFYHKNYEPEWTCDYEERMGSYGDGGKWVCNAYKIRAMTDCVVISIGSNDEWSFETAVHDLNPSCEIFTFDHTLENPHPPPFVKFFAFGVSSRDAKPNMVTLKGLLKMAGIAQRKVEILKIDCEACEYDVYTSFSFSFIRQVLIELHIPLPRVHNSAMNVSQWFEKNHLFFAWMQQHGYVTFHKEANLGCRGSCMEYGFIKLNLQETAVRGPTS